MVAIVAAVGVDVVPIADSFGAKLAAKLLPQAAAMGDSMGKAMGKPIAENIAKGVESGTSKASPVASGAKAGEQYGGAFARMVQARVTAALKNLPTPKIDMDTSPADRELTRIRADMARLRDVNIGVDMDSSEVLRQITTMQIRLQKLRSESPNIQVDVDMGKALTELAFLRHELSKLDGKNIRFDLKGDGFGAASAGLSGVTQGLGLVSAESATSNLSILALGGAGAALAPAIVPAATTVAAAIATVTVAAVAAGAAIGVILLVFTPIIKAVQALNTESTAASASAGNLANKQLAVAAATDQIKTAERNLASTRVENARNATRAEEGIVDARQSLALATRRVGDAERAVTLARRAYADAVENVATAERAVSDAQDGVVDARNRVTDADYALVQAQQSVTDAEDALAEAQQKVVDAQDGVVRANLNVVEAEHAVARAQQDSLDAQQGLTDARKDATRAMEDLNDQVIDGALDERAARVRVTQALQEYRKTLADNRAGAADREQAKISYEEAIQRFAELQRKNARLAEDKADSDKKGVEGSTQVVAAQKRIADTSDAVAASQQRLTDASAASVAAQRAVVEAQKAVVKAQRGITDAQHGVVEAQKQVADAKKGVVKAERDVADAQRGVLQAQRGASDAQHGIADAQRDVTDAQQGAVHAQRDLADAITNAADVQRQSQDRMAAAQQQLISAQRDLQRALNDTGTTGTSAMNRVAAAMANLSPAGKRFVAFIRGDMKNVLKQLSFAGQEGLLPGLQKGLTSLKPLLPILKLLVGNTAKALGDLAESAGKAFSSPFWKDFFAFVATTIGPNLKWMAKLGMAVATMFAILFKAFEPVGQQMGEALAQLAVKAADFLAAWVKTPAFQKFVDYMVKNAPLLGQLFLSLVEATLQLAIALAPLGPIVVLVVTAIADFLKQLSPKELLYILIAITTALLAVSLAVGSFGIAVVLAIALIVLVIAWWKQMWDHSKTLRRIVTDTFHAIGAVFTWLYRYIVKPIVGAIVAVFKVWLSAVKVVIGALVWVFQKILAPVFDWLYRVVIKPIMTILGVLFKIWYTIIKLVIGLVLLLLIALGKAFMWLYKKFIQPYFNEVGKEISSVWNKHIKPALSAFGDFLGKYVVPAFKGAIAAITSRWSSLVGILKKPVSFVVKTIFNDGLIKGYNWLADKVDKKLRIKEIPWPPKGWASGGLIPWNYSDGIVPGYAPGRDTHFAAVGGGEGVLRPEVARAIGADRINEWNYRARAGKSKILGYARGGLVKLPSGDTGSLVPELTAFARKSGVPFTVTSGKRNTNDYHGRGMAVDMASSAANMAKLARWLYQRSRQELELIHSGGGGFFVKNGLRKQASFYAKELAAHFNHVHLAMNWQGLSGADISKGGKDSGSSGGGLFDWIGGLKNVLVGKVKGVGAELRGMLGGDTAYAKLIGSMPAKAVNVVMKKGQQALATVASFLSSGGDNLSHTAKSGVAHSAQVYARSLFGKYGWGLGQVQPLVSLWNGESGWNPFAKNASSGAYGIPQALPGTKMASAGSDWQTNFKTQVRWGLDYIKSRYGAPANAFEQWTARSPHWYDDGGYLPQGMSWAMNGTGQRERILNPAETRAYEHGRDGSMTLRVIVDDGKLAGLVRVEIDDAMGSLADAHVYAGVS